MGLFMQPGTSRDADMLLADKKEIKTCLQNLLDEGQVIPVKIEGISHHYYTLPGILSVNCPEPCEPEVKFLSPFDNLIIQRDRTKQLFSFDYSLECYTPEHKRRYGYFVFTVLFKNNLVARFDPKADRKSKTLFLKGLWFEPGFSQYDELLPVFLTELTRFARFNECKKIVAEKCTDSKFLINLNRHLHKLVV
jgi:hypothetical protein